MRILAVDVGTGTQDILLFDTSGPVENSVKMVMPSPTAMACSGCTRAPVIRTTHGSSPAPTKPIRRPSSRPP